MEIITLLQGRPDNKGRHKRVDWWNERIARADDFFNSLKSAIKADSTDWNAVKKHVIDWQMNLEDYKDDKDVEFDQWIQAAKMFVIARFLSSKKNSEGYPESLLEDKTNLANEIYRSFAGNEVFPDVLSDYFVKPDDENLDEILVLCILFTKDNVRDWIEIHLAAQNDGDKESGEIFILLLKKVEGYGKCSPNPTFIKHPRTLVRSIKDNFFQSINHAYQLNRNHWKSCTDQSLLEKWNKVNSGKSCDELGIIWDIKSSVTMNKNAEKNFSAAETEPEIEKGGESAGLAATVGIYQALLNKTPDNRVVYSARLEISNDQPTGKFSPVKGIPAKINAAIAAQSIDTFVMHKENFQGNEKELIKQKLAGKSLRVIAIDSDGAESEMFPAFEEKTVPSNN